MILDGGSTDGARASRPKVYYQLEGEGKDTVTLVVFVSMHTAEQGQYGKVEIARRSFAWDRDKQDIDSFRVIAKLVIERAHQAIDYALHNVRAEIAGYIDKNLGIKK